MGGQTPRATHAEGQIEFVLTMLQPWATLTVKGLRNLETRSWGVEHRGRILIHASSSRRGLEFARKHPGIQRIFAENGLSFDGLPFGAIVGQVHLDSIEALASVGIADPKAFGWLVDGEAVWKLSKPEEWTSPISAKGNTGLWRWRRPAS
jgi:activating signal cointegrator 1